MSYKHKYINDYLIEYTTRAITSNDMKTNEMLCEGGNEKIAIDELKMRLSDAGVFDFKVVSVKKMASFPVYED